jgi:hypothetical protein
MAAESDGWAVARQRIAKEARERTGKLDLIGLGLEELPPEIAGLTHLRQLEMGWWPSKDFANYAGHPIVMRYNNTIADLAPLGGLTALQSLNCN